MKKEFFLKAVNFGTHLQPNCRAIQFETLESYLNRGGKIMAPVVLKIKPQPRNPVGPGISRTTGYSIAA